MLSLVEVKPKSLKDYQSIIRPEIYEEIQSRGKTLEGLKVNHVNATAVGGGVAEILSSMVGMMNDLGLKTSWLTIPPDEDFFNVTKKIHNTLQSLDEDLTEKEKDIFLKYTEKLGKMMNDHYADIWVIHDPQPVGGIKYMNCDINAVWRCHIDTTDRQESVWDFIKQFLPEYKRYIFSLDKFVPNDLDPDKILIMPPSIDPLSIKNRSMDYNEAKAIIEKTGIDLSRPLVTQVSRFDPWKDPKGVIDAYRMVKKDFPELQLAMVGLIIAKDDPEAYVIFDEVKEHAGDDPDIYLFADPEKIPCDNDTFVKAFQTVTNVIMQKSTREGFGLVVTEALWKGNPVIGGNVGGITLQIEDGVNGFLVNSPDEAADKLKYFLRHPEKMEEMGQAAHETVKNNFLHTRLLDDYLKLFQKIKP